MSLRIWGALAFVLISSLAHAQYPAKPIRLIVPFPAGTATDVAVRVVIAPLARQLGQPIFVDNKPGADGAIGGVELAKAAPDGYTLMVGSSSALVATPLLRKNPPYDPARAFAPISLLGSFNFLLLSNPQVPAATLAELLDYAKANPKKVSYATGNTAGIIGLGQVCELSGAQMVHVPYKGEPDGLLDVVSGRVDVMFATPATALNYLHQGKLRALATTRTSRSPLSPEVPTMAEAGMPGFSLVLFAALVGPANLPQPIAERLSKEVSIALARPEVREALDKQGFELSSSTPPETVAFLDAQNRFWAKAIADAGIEPN